MTEDEARSSIASVSGSDTVEMIGRFLNFVAQENVRQNLISASTLPQIWARHAYDSFQLLKHAAGRPGLWIDIGSGGGFPGMIVGIARSEPTLLVEPRRRRAEFLEQAISALGIGDRMMVAQKKMEQVKQPAAILSARAVAGIEALFEMAHHCAGADTRWLLPRGQIATEEVSSLRRRWKFMFHVEHSEVSSGSAIAVFNGVLRR